ncbi:MAG: 50S ribosomal protein L18 [Gammaproteobacteria bacterium]|nr:50S ribosomal protein L18 [Gammaproteobacteria bacterium]
MSDKNRARLRRAKKSRSKIAKLEAIRLSVHRTSQHFYAQIFDQSGQTVLASASTLESDVRQQLKTGGNCDAAIAVGKLLAEKAKDAGIDKVAFDRSGFRYHGRVKAFADSAREHGLKF